MFVLFHDTVVRAKKTNYIAIKVTKLCILYNMKTSLLLFYRQQHKQNKNICIKTNILILHSVPKTTYWNTVKSKNIHHSIKYFI